MPHHTKGVKNGTSSSLAEACIKRGCVRKIEYDRYVSVKDIMSQNSS